MKNIVLKTVVLVCVFAAAFFTACQQAVDPAQAAAQFTITVEQPENGALSASAQKAAAGRSVTITVTPEENFELAWLHVTGAERIPAAGTGGVYIFTMPSEAVTISARFISSLLQKQEVTVDPAIANGTVFPSHESAAAGVEVFLIPAPDDNYEITSVKVSKADDPSELVTAALLGDGYWFVMPEFPVLVTAEFADKNAVKKTITIVETDNGSVASSHSEAAAGTTVTITTTPDLGYKVNLVRVRRGSGANQVYLDVTNAGSNRYTFIVSSEPGNISVTVTFEALPEHAITIVPSEHGVITTSPADTAFETAAVTVTLTPDAGYKYRPGRLAITGGTSDSEILYTPAEAVNAFTFTMPEEDVSISAEFIDENIVLYGITVTPPAQYGAIEILHRLTEVEAGDSVTVILKPQSADYRYKAGTLSIPGAVDLTEITSQQDGINRRWTFTMPAAAVTISAEFEMIPTYLISVPAISNGSITTSPSGRVRANTEVTVTLTITDPDNYRYSSIALTPAFSLTPVTGEALKWKFTMPSEETAADVAVSAVIEEIPAHTVTISLTGETSHGSISAAPLVNENKAREGKTITITAVIDDTEEYRIDPSSFSVQGTGLPLVLSPVSNSVNTWTFVMPQEAVTISAEIAVIPFKNVYLTQPDHGTIVLSGAGLTDGNKSRPGRSFTVTITPDNDAFELYKGSKGGLATGVTQNYIWGYYSGTQLDYDTAPGRSTGFALRAAGGVGENCIGLFPAEPVDLTGMWKIDSPTAATGSFTPTGQNTWTYTMGEDDVTISADIVSSPVTALSFWAKVSNGAEVQTEFMGFGAGENAVLYKTETGTGNLIIQTAEWKHYIIPVPYQKEGAAANRIFIKIQPMAAGTDLYFDDIEFIPDDITLGISIPSSLSATVDPETSYNAADLLSAPPKIKYTHGDGTFATLTDNIGVLDVQFRYSNWNLPALEYEVDGNAAISDGVITTTTAGTFNLYAKIGAVRSNAMAITIAPPPANIMIDAFEGEAGSSYISNGIGSYPRGGEHYTGADAFGDGTPIAVSNTAYAMTGNGLGGKNIAPPLNLANAGKIVFWAWSNTLEGNTFTFKLKNGTDTPSYFSKTITLTNTGGAGAPASWNKIEIPFTELTAESGGTLDKTRITGYVYAIDGTAGGTHAIDNLRAEE